MADSVTPEEDQLPLIISVDDHVMEPKDLWQRELPESMRERGPKVVTERVKLEFTGGHYGFSRNDPDGTWCDLWLFDDLVVPTGLLHAPAGMPRDEQRNVPATYDDFRPGTWDRTERLADMTTNHVEAAINYPNVFPRFAGQGFLERDDKDLSLACLRIYNDWMIDEWSAGRRQGPPHPADPRARCGTRRWPPRRSGGAPPRAATPSPSPRTRPSSACRRCTRASGTSSGRPAWRPTRRCRCTSARRRRCPRPRSDAPLATSMSLYAQNAQGSLADWVFSGTLERHPDLKIAYAESQVGWMPFQLERMDAVWADGRGGVGGPVLPSEQVRGRVYGCVFDDLVGLKARHDVGLEPDPVRDRLPALRRHVPAPPQGGPRPLRRRRHGRRRVLRRPPRQRHRGLRPPALRHHRVALRTPGRRRLRRRLRRAAGRGGTRRRCLAGTPRRWCAAGRRPGGAARPHRAGRSRR